MVLYNPRAVFHTMPLGLLAVGSALDPKRFRVEIVDARLERDPHRALLAALDGALCLGLGVLTGDPIRDALAASRAAKARHPDLPVVWGGWHPSLFPAATLDEPTIDAAVAGQGEAAFVEVVERLAAGGGATELAGIPGVASRDADGHLVSGPPRSLADVNDLPAHDYELIAVDRYFAAKGSRQLDYVASAGCLFRCAFCADPFVYKRRWSGLAPARVGEEAERLQKRHGFDELAFQDETFFTYRDHSVEIAEEFLRRGLRFSWTATLRADQAERLTDEMFAICVASGLRRVMIGVESGSPDMLTRLAKDITVEQVMTAAERCLRHGLGAIFPFIVGFPDESDESVEQTLALILRLRAMSPDFETPVFYFKPYPGSRLTSEIVRQGYRLPCTLEEWADFDFVGSSGPWVSADKNRLIERFKFYNRMGYGRGRGWDRPAKALARWRLRRRCFGFPVEKAIAERLRPQPRLS